MVMVVLVVVMVMMVVTMMIDHAVGGGGDPLHGPLSILGGDIRVDALVAKVRDDRPQECLRLLHVVERRRDILERRVRTALKGSKLFTFT